jgi:hypothetical protein
MHAEGGLLLHLGVLRILRPLNHQFDSGSLQFGVKFGIMARPVSGQFRPLERIEYVHVYRTSASLSFE